MFGHMLDKRGDFMAGYRFMYNWTGGNMRNGTHLASDQTIIDQGCGGQDCQFTPANMDMRMHIQATRAWLADVTTRFEGNPRDAATVADICLLKNQATRTMQHCADAAVQILGGMGYMRGTKSERIYREVKVMMIGGGAEEIMKDLAARQLGV